MDETTPSLPPPMLLAISYAHPGLRPRLRWLLLLDLRLAQLVHRASEPLIAQMRLAWWREALSKPAEARPKGEPLLAALADLEGDPALLVAGVALVDAAEALVLGQSERAATARAKALVDAYVGWARAPSEFGDRLIEAWAGRKERVLSGFPRSLRPMTILSLAEMLEVRSPGALSGWRLVWYALTGR